MGTVTDVCVHSYFTIDNVYRFHLLVEDVCPFLSVDQQSYVLMGNVCRFPFPIAGNNMSASYFLVEDMYNMCVHISCSTMPYFLVENICPFVGLQCASVRGLFIGSVVQHKVAGVYRFLFPGGRCVPISWSNVCRLGRRGVSVPIYCSTWHLEDQSHPIERLWP